jgi:hypothetical protein
MRPTASSLRVRLPGASSMKLTPLEAFTDWLGWLECVECCAVRRIMSYGAAVRATSLHTTFTSGQEFCREIIEISKAHNDG